MQWVTFSLFRFENWRQQRWMLAEMQRGHGPLQNTQGLSFYKLLGSGGGNGFSIWPDWSVYALLAVWESQEAAQDFFGHPKSYFQQLARHSSEVYTLDLRPRHAHGQWSGRQPFKAQKDETLQGPVAVLTRARIKWRHIPGFWRWVPGVSAGLYGHPDCLLAKGVGEWPLIQQATLSVWTSEQAMKNYAYHDPRHREVIRQTRERAWYSEEMFTRFTVLSARGSWKGKKPLQAYLASLK